MSLHKKCLHLLFKCNLKELRCGCYLVVDVDDKAEKRQAS